jgi:hypothetical protein
LDAFIETNALYFATANQIESQLFEMSAHFPFADRNGSIQTRVAGFAFPRFVAVVLCAVALLAVGTSWDFSKPGTEQRQAELEAIEVSSKTAELMWGNHDDDDSYGVSRHKPLRWSSDGYEIRDRVRQMSADLRAFDRHIAEQTVLNTQYKKAVAEMRAKYKRDERIIRLMLRSGLMSESERIDQLGQHTFENVSYLQNLVDAIKNGEATDGVSATATIKSLNASYNSINASRRLPQVVELLIFIEVAFAYWKQLIPMISAVLCPFLYHLQAELELEVAKEELNRTTSAIEEQLNTGAAAIRARMQASSRDALPLHARRAAALAESLPRM